jgi:hypothetical protein
MSLKDLVLQTTHCGDVHVHIKVKKIKSVLSLGSNSTLYNPFDSFFVDRETINMQAIRPPFSPCMILDPMVKEFS